MDYSTFSSIQIYMWSKKNAITTYNINDAGTYTWCTYSVQCIGFEQEMNETVL